MFIFKNVLKVLAIKVFFLSSTHKWTVLRRSSTSSAVFSLFPLGEEGKAKVMTYN